MKLLQFANATIPYTWKKWLLDIIKPDRPGIGPVLRRMSKYCDPKVVFDIGANVGDISCYFLHYFPQATVHAFEPCLSTYDQLVANVYNKGLSERFRPHRLGFFDEETVGTLQVTSFHGANSLIPLSAEFHELHPHITSLKTEQIPLIRLDDFVARENIDRIDLVKIDVEGAERQVLKGGWETFSSKVDMVIMEISFLRHSRQEGEYLHILQTMHELGFAPAEIYDVSQSDKVGPWKLMQFDCVFRKYK